MENSQIIFIVEDDPFYGAMLEYYLTLNPDYTVERFETGKSLLENLFRRPIAITLDYSLPDMDGETVLKRIHKENPEIPVIIISGQEDISTAVQLLKNGAYDYIVKDANTKERLWNSILKIKETQELRAEISQLREEVREKYEFDKAIKGNSAALHRIFSLMEKASKSNINVSIHGETGTGKELVAKAIHHNSTRNKKPFVAVNMAAIPKDLVESELFGHEKGAFTGAISRRIGKFEEANGGTLFLDEIGEMELTMQAKILRVLQEQEITRIGGNQIVKIDCRIIVATHRNLAEEVQKGNFREDLYYRLLGLNLQLPPLRERGNDIIVLSKYFIEEYSKKNRVHKISLSNEASQKLLSYSYPGNIRELKAIIELACVMAIEDTISADDITFNSIKPEGAFLLDEVTLREYNRRIIRHFLNKYDDDVLLVAEKLDIGKSTIYNMLKSGEL
ncbi:putative two component, sigma54 specific, transcriptional regulator [Emticicia oligotrophica DSM 17448]|uniref:Two component, sigma54 specific, transcriptional regulator n=1 Tax=Emticicia oligotrophica (strain DSM 17448 / CIP 109782 / MTCC 6937 / GPTSA100-15) TaxID=929562 RepID=A0ABM5N6C6_EMTOG|nr:MULTISPECIES: sigma-54 dependent transcriptional regulator [Emticicia]AFK04959.1 putative two component, sigma54 specific, transcriptional regulator [Emticicia oligotrophica DSM 17448]